MTAKRPRVEEAHDAAHAAASTDTSDSISAPSSLKKTQKSVAGRGDISGSSDRDVDATTADDAGTPSSSFTPRLVKRRRSSSSSSERSSSKGVHNDRPSVLRTGGSHGGEDEDTMLQQETLRISNEMLRTENQQLQNDIETLEEAKEKLEKQLTVSEKRIRDLEGDVSRLYRGLKKEVQTKQVEHDKAMQKLQDQLDALNTQIGGSAETDATETESRASASPPTMTMLPLVSARTAHEMDSFFATCLQWQSKLTGLSVDLEKQVAKIEDDEVKSVLCELVANVDISGREEQVLEREREVQMMRLSMLQQQEELQQMMQKMRREREETDAFEALERRVLEDRIAELEVQLTQIKVREFEKDEEITILRAEREELDACSHILPRSEWEAQLAETQRWIGQAEEWKQKCDVQMKQTSRLQEELRTVNNEMQRLEGQVHVFQEQEETRAFEALEKRILEERIEELETQLKSAGSKQEQEREAFLEEREKEKRALTDDLEAVQLELSVAAAETTVKKNEVARLVNDKMELKKQMKVLAADWKKAGAQLEVCKAQLGEQRVHVTQLKESIVRLKEANEALVEQRGQGSEEVTRLKQQSKELKEQELLKRRRVSDEVSKLQEKNAELREQERLRARDEALKTEQIKRLEGENQELEQRMAAEIARLQLQNQQLLDQETKRSGGGGVAVAVQKSPTATDDSEVARLVHEKRAVQEFFRCYFEAAERKCRQLMHQLSQQEAQRAHHRQQAKDSCQMLRMCTQVESCDASVRSSILDVVSTLESIS